MAISYTEFTGYDSLHLFKDTIPKVTAGEIIWDGTSDDFKGFYIAPMDPSYVPDLTHYAYSQIDDDIARIAATPYSHPIHNTINLLPVKGPVGVEQIDYVLHYRIGTYINEDDEEYSFRIDLPSTSVYMELDFKYVCILEGNYKIPNGTDSLVAVVQFNGPKTAKRNGLDTSGATFFAYKFPTEGVFKVTLNS
jgi:hypothetical protein